MVGRELHNLCPHGEDHPGLLENMTVMVEQ